MDYLTKEKAASVKAASVKVGSIKAVSFKAAFSHKALSLNALSLDALSLKVRTALYNLRSPPQQSINCHIVNLPDSVLFRIISYLPLHSQFVLAQTCRSFSKFHPDEPLPAKDVFRYLACIARDDPNRWACEACRKLHPVRAVDIPAKPDKTNCPLGAKRLRSECGSHGRFETYNVSHRHVQTALKYTRLDLEGKLSWWERRHLRCLLAAYKGTFTPSLDLHRDARACMSYWPKVVDGRFLMGRSYCYSRFGMGTPISLNKLGKLTICPHQHFIFDDCGVLQSPPNRLSNLIRRGFEMRLDFPLESCCEHCLTDFEVLCDREQTEIMVWSDLGPEAPSLHPAWTRQVFCDYDPDNETPLTHENGSVREAFRQYKGSWKIYDNRIM